MRCTKCEVSPRPRRLRGPVLILGLLAAGALGLTACAPAPLSTSSLTSTSSSPAASSPGTDPTTGPSSSPASPGPTTPDPVVTTLPSSSGSTSRTTAPTATSTATSSATSSSTVVTATGHVETAFATTEGGIVCAISADGPQARCDLESSTWTPPPAPADCHGAWGAGLSLTSAGAELTCTTDTVLADAATGGAGTWWQQQPAARTVSRPDGRQEVTLAPGATVVAGSGASRLTCSSTATTVTCTAGSARFSVSKTSYSLR